MTIDKFGRHLYASRKANINEELKQLVQNLIDILQLIPLAAHHLPRVDLNNIDQWRAMTDPNLFDQYRKYSEETENPWFFRAWFESKFIYKHEL